MATINLIRQSSNLPSFRPSCPSGGSWYACGNGAKFVGCCGSNPCNDNGCSAGNLYPASFDKSAYGQFSDQECSAGQWYTCAAINPPFMGCCKSNPCQPGGCSKNDLASGYLSDNPSKANQFNPSPPLNSGGSLSSSATSSSSSRSEGATSTMRSSSASASSLVIVTVTPTSAASSTAIPMAKPASLSGGKIGGIAVGGVAGVALLLLAILLYSRHHKSKSRRDHESRVSTSNAGFGELPPAYYEKQQDASLALPRKPSIYEAASRPINEAGGKEISPEITSVSTSGSPGLGSPDPTAGAITPSLGGNSPTVGEVTPRFGAQSPDMRIASPVSSMGDGRYSRGDESLRGPGMGQRFELGG